MSLCHRILKPHEGFWGTWSDFSNCTEGFINGAELETYPKGNSGSTWDDRSATNLRMFCSNGETLEGVNWNGKVK